MSRRFWNTILQEIAVRQETTKNRRRSSFRPTLEQMEELVLPSATTILPSYVLSSTHGSTVHPANGTGPGGGLAPSQELTAYGISGITFNSGGTTVPGNGAGQTIAIIDAYDNPDAASDLATFDTEFGLAAPPSFTKIGINASGTNTGTLPSANSGWSGESSLDVEWAHAVAPDAYIVLIEANSASNTDLLNAINYADNYVNPATGKGVAAISMSWGGSEFSGEASDDSYFTTPANHPGGGITYIASAGDSGSPAIWPSISTHVVGVGGTTLTTDTNGDYEGESAWSDTGGGLSADLSAPSYQSGLVISNGSATISAGGKRAGPDVAFDANPSSGVSVYSAYGFGGWVQVGGTSMGAPQWAGIMAIIDQGVTLDGGTDLNGYTQTLPQLYQLSSSDFHDITTGSNNQYSAGPGFDLVTGRGTPVANKLIADMSGNTGSTTQPPTVATGAYVVSSSPTTVTLGALGADAAGDPLSYTWTATGPASVSFSSNGNVPGTGVLDTTTATFRAAGTYNFTVTIEDTVTGQSVTSQLSNYVVSQVPTTVSVSPASATVNVGATYQFSAKAYDQFGTALATQPTFTWTIASGVGSVSSSGLYTAPATAGSAVVQAAGDTLSGTAAVTVAALTGPTITTAAHVSSPTGTTPISTTATLNVAATDPAGTSSLTYTWSLTGTPPASVSYSANGTNAAQTTTVTFSAVGTYNFLVTVKDTNNLTATSSVTVTVGQVLTTITVSPSTATVNAGATQQFTAAAKDQFGNAYSATITWTASAGTITTGGLFTAPTTSGTITITAASGSVQGHGTVTVPSASGTVLFSDNFTSGASQWTVESGDYYLVSYRNGTHALLVENYGGLSRIVAGSSSWTNYSFQGTVALTNNYGGSISLMARVVDENHFYFFGYDVPDDAWIIARKDGPNVTTMLAVGTPFNMQLGVGYVVQANVDASSLSLSVNGVLQVATTDSTYASGKIGFTSTYAYGTLENVTVTALSSPNLVLGSTGGTGTTRGTGSGTTGAALSTGSTGGAPAGSGIVLGGNESSSLDSGFHESPSSPVESNFDALMSDLFWGFGRF
jgi:hypothetical protein